jgi:hypothetical protein
MRILLLVSLAVVAADGAMAQQISIPSDRTANYTAMQITRKANDLVEIATRRIGTSGTTFALREVNCRTTQARYLGEGDTLEEAMRRKNSDSSLKPLLEGSISWEVSRYACQQPAR